MGKTYKKNSKNRFEKKKLLATKHKKKYPKKEEQNEDEDNMYYIDYKCDICGAINSFPTKFPKDSYEVKN